MIEDLKLRGYSESTQTLYVTAVRQLCEHFGKSPGTITEEELRVYFLYSKNIKKWSRSTSTFALCGIKFFYENTIKRPWPTLLFIRPGREKRLPVVLSRDEVREFLSNIELLRYRVCLTTIYSRADQSSLPRASSRHSGVKIAVFRKGRANLEII